MRCNPNNEHQAMIPAGGVMSKMRTGGRMNCAQPGGRKRRGNAAWSRKPGGVGPWPPDAPGNDAAQARRTQAGRRMNDANASQAGQAANGPEWKRP